MAKKKITIADLRAFNDSLDEAGQTVTEFCRDIAAMRIEDVKPEELSVFISGFSARARDFADLACHLNSFRSICVTREKIEELDKKKSL